MISSTAVSLLRTFVRTSRLPYSTTLLSRNISIMASKYQIVEKGAANSKDYRVYYSEFESISVDFAKFIVNLLRRGTFAQKFVKRLWIVNWIIKPDDAMNESERASLLSRVTGLTFALSLHRLWSSFCDKRDLFVEMSKKFCFRGLLTSTTFCCCFRRKCCWNSRLTAARHSTVCQPAETNLQHGRGGAAMDKRKDGSEFIDDLRVQLICGMFNIQYVFHF